MDSDDRTITIIVVTIIIAILFRFCFVDYNTRCNAQLAMENGYSQQVLDGTAIWVKTDSSRK